MMSENDERSRNMPKSVHSITIEAMLAAVEVIMLLAMSPTESAKAVYDSVVSLAASGPALCSVRRR